MENTLAKIKEYVLLLDPLPEESENIIEFVIAEIVDRVLAYTNREQLAENAIPRELERVVAQTVLRVIRNNKQALSAETGAITKVKDHNQEVTFSTQVQNFLNDADDAKIFSGSTTVLEKYILPTVPYNK